jgi:WD40 repeat protein/energy-coupling factor transporter ATP-binding protein EcfA2
VRQQIVWLDCCFAGELLNFTEADLGTTSQGQTRFLIAAAREFELAEEDVQGQYGAFSRILWQGLDPRRQPQGVVNNDRLIEYIDQTLKGFPHQPIWYNPHREIILTGAREQVFVATPDGICPYKGLRFFDVGDAPYFYGREALTQKLIERVQVSKGNFLAVLGVSGSGKSSLLRAGLMYQLQEERRLPGTEQWKIRIFTPGEQPLVSLATAFLDEEITDIERAGQLRKAEAAIKEGATGLARLIRASKSPRTVLIVDQFEEVFTPSVKANNRQQFISSLLGALKQTGDKLCLILAMRDDFLGKCAAYRELADLIQANLVMVTPMSAQELRLAIVEPATKLGRKVEVNLINAILKDLGVKVQYSEAGGQISEPEPGMLPLLEYTLEQLWQRQVLNWLKLDSYNQLGGVQKTLENLAEQAYSELSDEEQRVADQIFIKLTQLGEGTPDTRKQVTQQDLVTQSQSAELVEQVIQKLAQAKLIVTSEQRKGQEKVAVVDVAHEALIRHWSRLRELLDNNREAIRTRDKIETAAEDWKAQHKPKEEKGKGYLLEGLRLGKAEEFLQEKIDIVPLSSLAQEFIEESQKERDHIQAEKDRQRRQTILRLTGFSIFALILAGIAGVGWWRTIIAEKNSQLIARSQSSEALFASNQELDALLESIRAGKQMKREFGIKTNTEMQILGALFQAVYGVRELNRFEGYNQPFMRASFSSNGKSIAAVSEDGSIQIWDLDGSKKATIDNKYNSGVSNGDYFVSSISFSSKSNIIVSLSQDNNIKVWNFEGQEIYSFKNQLKDTVLTSISPDGTTIAAINLDGLIKVWQRDTQKLYSFQHFSDIDSLGWVSALSFSPDGNLIASAADDNVKIWNFNGQEPIILEQGWMVSSLSFSPTSDKVILTEEGNKVTLWSLDGEKLDSFDDFGVTGAIFSPEGSQIATFGSNIGDIKLWHNGNGRWEIETTLTGHSSTIHDVSFNPNNSSMLVSVSADHTVKVWDLEGVEPAKFRTSNGTLGDISLSPDGKVIATVSADGSLKIWNLEGSLKKNISEEVSVFSKITFSSDGKKIISSHRNKVQFWNIETGESKIIIEQESPRRPSQRNDFGRAIFSKNNTKIVVGKQDGTIKILSLDGREVKTLTGGGEIVVYSPNGKILASASKDNTIKLWNTEGKELLPLVGSNYAITSLVFSPDSKILVAGNENGNILIFDVAGRTLKTLQGHTNSVWSLDFRPDGFIFASGSGSSAKTDAGIIKFWSIDGQEIKSFRTNGSTVRSLNFGSDGETLIYGDGLNVNLWNLELDYLLDKGCDWVRGYLEHNPNVSESDRHLCDGIGTAN